MCVAWMRHQRAIDIGMVEQPFDRPRARPGDAIVDLTRLFGDVDVDRAGRLASADDAREFLRRHRAQRVRRDADDARRAIRDQRAARVVEQAREAVDIIEKRRCPGSAARRRNSHAHRNTGSSVRPMPRVAAAADDALGHLARSGIGRAVGRVMQIMEFADRGKAGLQHLDIERRGDRLDIVGRQRQRETIHRLAPGPEIVGVGPRVRRAPPWRAERRGCADWPSRARRRRAARRLRAAATPVSIATIRSRVERQPNIVAPAVRQSALSA